MALLSPTAGGRVRVYVKRQLRFDLLDFDRQQMYRLGVFGVAEVLDRVSKALGPEDQKAKPLVKSYAIRKSRFGLRNVRDLRGFGGFGGHMLDNLKVRTVGLNDVRAGFSSKKMQDKARGNERRQPFMAFSPRNVQRIAEVSRKIFTREIVPNVVKTIAQ
jgi:hypothetical protein